MELQNEQEFKTYIRNNYKLLATLSSDSYSEQIDGRCDACQRDAYLKIYSSSFNTPHFSQNESTRFTIFYIQCPSCHRKSFIHTVRLRCKLKDDENRETEEWGYEYFQLYRLPTLDENFSNKDIPDIAEYSTLKQTVSEASFCLTNGKYVSSAIMFRRAIQIIAKQVLGAQGKSLYNQLEWLKGNVNLLKIDLTEVFHDNMQLIKDIGNQGAHPDDDIELHAFSKSDADGLHDLFIHLIQVIFVIPAKLKALQEELKSTRKIKR